jgi:acetylornithine deacetylase/succinyl-diaminopimelate desuccinylase-like protein
VILDKAALEKVCAQIDSYEDEIIDLQKNLTSRPALAPENGGEGEQKKAEYIESYLRDRLGCEQIDTYHAPDDRVPAGFNTVVWATQDETLHEPNEYVKMSNIMNDAKVFAHVALQTY